MKKFATIAVLAAFAASASGASIQWGFGGKVYLDNGSETTLSTAATAPSVASGSYLALVYLGQNISSYTLDDITAAKVVDSMNYGVATTGKSSAISKWSPTNKTYGDSTMESGASFAVLFYNAESSSFDYIYALSGTSKGEAFASNILTVSSEDMVRASGTIYGTGSSSANGVLNVAAAPIPEPGTAAMALLGLGLLIRRRKA